MSSRPRYNDALNHIIQLSLKGFFGCGQEETFSCFEVRSTAGKPSSYTTLHCSASVDTQASIDPSGFKPSVPQQLAGPVQRFIFRMDTSCQSVGLDAIQQELERGRRFQV